MTAIDILDSFDADDRSMSAADLITRSGVPRSSAFRDLKYLVKKGYLFHDPSTKMYSLGPRMLSLGVAARQQLSSEERVTAPLLDLLNRVGETVTFSLLDLPMRTCVYVLEAPSDLRQVVRVGARYPLHLGSAGKVILAQLPVAVARTVLEGEHLSVENIEELLAECDSIRRAGFSLTTGERVAGATSLAAPVFVGRTIYGSVAVAGPTDRAATTMRGNESLLAATAHELSMRLSEKT